MGHARRAVDVLLYVRLIVFAADDLNQAPEQNKSVVGVLKFGTGFEGERPVSEQLDVVIERTNLQTMRFVFGRENVAGSAGMVRS